MNKKDWPLYIELINREVVPALGCTEPIAVALAAARAAEELGKPPENIDAYLSGNILKNGMSVGIPGTGLYGLDTAAAVGALGGKSELQLEVLKEISPEALKKAKVLLAKDAIRIHHRDCPEILYIEIILTSGNDSVKVIIKDLHTNICLVEHNGKIVFEKVQKEEKISSEEEKQVKMTERDVWDFAMNAPLEDLRFILITAEVNSRISEEGLKGDYGLRVGRCIDENIAKGLLVSDLSNEAVRRTAGGTDARMAGSALPVICNSGSGNQGITATMPVVAVVEKLAASEEQLIRALILSHLTSIHIKSSMNRLTALCGASVAATGASCAIVYLLGGQYEQIEYAIKNMVGNVSGIICDGAKNACSLKVASCVSAGVQGALLAINGISVSDNEGIVEADVERTIANLVRLSSPGMLETDKIILEIMTHKGGLKEKTP
ncbi:MAG: hypothetical protein B6241_11910 [Spirochaetaceae bacterium 4572_59]|nr:MAG: hypothetical protein B6241_11910 [Spirochaetaceae bacterium 4572_59]